MSDKELEKKDSSEIEIIGTINKLADLLQDSIDLVNRNRQIAIDHKKSLEGQLEEYRRQGFIMSEDGTIEAEITKTVKIISESAKQMKEPIVALTKILQAKMTADAIKNSMFPRGKRPYTGGPIDVSDYDDHDHEYDD